MGKDKDNDTNGLDRPTPLRLAMLQLREIYLEARHAGFTRGEGIELVAKLINDSRMNDDDTSND